MEEEWFMNGTDSFLTKKCEYDLLNENKEASWLEWVNRKGRASKNLLIKEIQGDYLHVYSYSLKNGYPIAKQEILTSSTLNYLNFYNYTWSCLQ